MCMGCWKKAGSPKIETDEVLAAALWIDAVYNEMNCEVGGDLHCQLDDYNLDDASFDDKEEKRIRESNLRPETRLVELRCFNLMRSMTEQERISACALYDGFWTTKRSLA